MKKFHTPSDADGHELAWQLGAAVGYHGTVLHRRCWGLAIEAAICLSEPDRRQFSRGLKFGKGKLEEDEAAGKVVRL